MRTEREKTCNETMEKYRNTIFDTTRPEDARVLATRCAISIIRSWRFFLNAESIFMVLVSMIFLVSTQEFETTAGRPVFVPRVAFLCRSVPFSTRGTCRRPAGRPATVACTRDPQTMRVTHAVSAKQSCEIADLCAKTAHSKICFENWIPVFCYLIASFWLERLCFLFLLAHYFFLR